VIARLWRGRALPESADRYEHHVTTAVFPRLRELPGFIRGRVLRRTIDHRVEFLVMTEWASWDAIRSFAGDTPHLAVVEPDARAALSDFDAHVEHFEEIGV
jgi:heme-degrading monooxygenase HmoA